ncbi:hypothetical protein [Flagellimonas sp.]|uniref:hypothetical protein n=1 Tax=Flagellimonas sp. TaxID=2058762 RepID=UPI003BABDA76
MATRRKRGFMGWLLLGAIAIVAAVFHEKIKGWVSQVPVLKDVVGKLEEQA